MWNFPDQGSNSCPLYCKREVLTTGPSGKSRFLDLPSAIPPGSPVSRLSKPCRTLLFKRPGVPCVPLLTHDLGRSPLGLSLRDLGQSPPSPPSLAPLSLPEQASHGAARGRIAQARPLPGPAENVLATAGSAVGEDCFEAPQIRSPSGVLLPQVADHSLEPGRDFLPAAVQPGTGPLGGTGMTMRACAKLNTCWGLSSCPLRARQGEGGVLYPFRPGENRGTELQLCDITQSLSW